MSPPLSAVALTSRLIGFDTINPPGQEAACAGYLADLLSEAGFECVLHRGLGADRASLVATLHGKAQRVPALGFTGHIDTVPLGARPWSQDPFAGAVVDGKLYGRGASDMKGGVAAFTVAAIAEADKLRDGPGVVLIITAGEETGCDGAYALARDGALGRVGALVVAEPTSNAPLIGHKGALWLKALTAGVTAHGSMPEHGVNALYKAARVVSRLAEFDFNVARHPMLGKPTLNVGTVHGGMNVNSVPDRAEIGVDIRTIPGMSHDALRAGLIGYMGEDAEVDVLVDVPGVWTDPAQPWLVRAAALTGRVTGEPVPPRTAPYFTDASVLTPALGGVPTLILGPGEMAMAHQTDEYCLVERLDQAVAVFRGLIADWSVNAA